MSSNLAYGDPETRRRILAAIQDQPESHGLELRRATSRPIVQP